MPCWRQQRNWLSHSALAVVSMPPSPVVSTLRGWKEKQAMSAVRPADLLPLPVPRISLPMAQAASSITGSACRRAIGRMARQVAGHAELVHAEDGAGARGDGRFDQLRIDVEGQRVDVHEHRRRAAIADAVGRGDEGMADRDHLVAGPTPTASSARCRAVVQLETAQAWGAPT